MTMETKMWRAAIITIALFSGTLDCSAAQRCTAIPVKANKVAWVARDITVRGHDEAIAMLRLAGTPQDVDAQARAYWRAQHVPAFGTGKNGAFIVQAIDTQCLYLLNIAAKQDSGQTLATYSVIDLAASASTGPALRGVPMPGAVDSLDVSSRDATSVAHTGQFALSGSPEKEGQAYAAALKSAGWSVSGNVLKSRTQSASAAALSAVKGNETLVATFGTEHGKTQAVVNVSQPR